jgi:hypothetical protein
MNPLHNLLLQLENQIPNLDTTNSRVSNSTIGWQIDHCLLVINGVISQLEVSNPTEFQPKFNFPKFMVFTIGKIPRGKARAPKTVNPTEKATVIELQTKIELAKKNILKLTSFSENLFFKHPFFGDLNKKQTEKFLAIHTKHHLNIIQDILR